MKLKWIDLGIIDPKLVSAIWEYSRIFTLKCPVVFSFRVSKLFLENCSKNDLVSDMIYLDKINEPYHHNRYFITNSIYASGVYTWNKHVLGLFFHKPSHYKINQELIATFGHYRTKGINCIYKRNDKFFIDSKGNHKKFSGIFNNSWNNGWSVSSLTITYHIDTDFLDKIYNLNHHKILKKLGNKKTLKDIVGGLYEVNQNLNIDEDTEHILKNYANSFDLELSKENLSEKELNVLNKLADMLDNDEWKNDLKYPDIGDIYEIEMD